MKRFLDSRALGWIFPLTLALAACADASNDDTTTTGTGGAGGGSGGGMTTTSSGGAGGGFVTSTGGSGGSGDTTATTSTSSTGGGATGGGGTGGAPPIIDPTEYPYETETNGTLGTANAFVAGTLGFQGSLSSASDVDIFSIDAPLGATMRVAISDGNGGCPSDANVFVQIYSPNNLELVAETGLCPLLDGNQYPELASLDQAGTYFIRITSSGAPVSIYAVEISVTPPVCGDGITQIGEECDDGNMVAADGCEIDCTLTPDCGDAIVETGEECDDGNMASGDGCDSTCQLEGNFCPEGEPNDSFATATLLTSCSGGAGVISIAGDADYYKFNVTTAGSSLRAEVVDVLGVPNTCPTGFDSKIYLYNASMTEIGSDDDDGFNACSLITPNDAFATNLPAGTYYIRVEEYGNNGTSPPYILNVTAAAPGCGDSITQSGEQCDDGNVVSGDGCSATCQIEGSYCAQAEINDDIASATPITAACTDGGSGQITPVADKDFFSFDVTAAGSSARIEVTSVNGSGCPTGFDSFLRLYNSAGAEIGTDDQDGADSCSLIDPVVDTFARNLPAGTYYIDVEEAGNNATSQPYLVKVDVTPPGCGDHILQPGEECDDGNVVDGDGCSALCEIEGNFCVEGEPNDNFAQSTTITTCDGGTGAINYVTDADWYSFQVTVPNSSVRLEVVDVVGSGCPTGLDSNLRLFNAAMMQLGTDNDDGNASCSLITPVTDTFARNLAVGTYYARVEENGNDATSPAYVLLVDVNPPGCGDGIVQAGEQCDDGNTIDGDGCSSTCALLACAPGEVMVTIDSTDVPKTIVDDDPSAPALSTINVAQTGTVTKIALRVNIAHTYMGDVVVELDPPGATPANVVLANNIGSSGDNMVDTIFSSASTTDISTGTPPWSGVWAPDVAPGFTPVIGTPSNGAWTLSAFDNSGGIAGTLTGYSLYLCVAP